MQLNHVIEFVINHLFAKLLRRVIGAILLVLFTLAATCYLTIAGTFVLDGLYGMLYARLIVAVIYIGAALIVLIVLFATRAMPPVTIRAAAVPVSARDAQTATLIQAAMLGYAMARKSGDRIY